MDVKKESKIIISALLLGPIGAGIVLVIQGVGAPYGWLLIILSLIVLLWLWQPWKWFQGEDNTKHKNSR